MTNLYDHSIASTCKYIKCDDLLFVEYRCTPGTSRTCLWSHYGHVAYLTSGKKTWITPEGACSIGKGEAIYCKKGTYHVLDSMETDVCVLLFFLPDEFIREVILEFRQGVMRRTTEEIPSHPVLKLNVDLGLHSFFESVMSYFFIESTPSPELVKIKFKELVLQILTNHQHTELAHYFRSLVLEEDVNIRQVMQENYLYDLSLAEFARLCNRSLSTFKRDFQRIFGISPGRWLIEQRLKYARVRLLSTDANINAIACESGFDSASNFIRRFKKEYGASPKRYRTHSILHNKEKNKLT